MKVKKYKKMLFSQKLSISVIVAILIPMLCSIIILYTVWENALQTKTNEYLQNTASVTISQLENSIKYIEKTGFYVATNNKVQNIILSKNEKKATDSEYVEYQQLRELLSSYIAVNEEITAMYLKGKTDQIYSYTKSGIPFAIVDEILDKAFKDTRNWFIIDGNVFYVQEIRKSLAELMGKLVINVNVEALYHIIEGIDYADSGEVYIINENNQIVVAKDNTSNNEEYISDEYKKLNLKNDKIYENIIVNGESKTIYSSKSLKNGWRVIISIPTSYYMKDITSLKNKMLVIVSAIAIFGLLVVITISKRLTKPLKNLADEMEKVGHGDLHTHISVDNGDEIATLNETFNQMVKDMRELIKTEYQQKVLIKGAEMKSLQMQINPHFLYNTLDTINWMARMKGNDEVGDITSALGKLMRYSLSKKEYVTIGEEIENLYDYVKIQDVRYGDKVTVHFEISEDIKEYYIPKLLIQPILENALVHGVEDKIDESNIYVKAFSAEENVNIIIEDDGVGMTLKTQENLLSEETNNNKKHTSIGLYNVNKRIKMVYGEDYGLQIQSILGNGTKITLIIKKDVEI